MIQKRRIEVADKRLPVGIDQHLETRKRPDAIGVYGVWITSRSLLIEAQSKHRPASPGSRIAFILRLKDRISCAQ